MCASSGGGDVDVVGLGLEALEGVAEAAHDGPGDSSALKGVVEGARARKGVPPIVIFNLLDITDITETLR